MSERMDLTEKTPFSPQIHLGLSVLSDEENDISILFIQHKRYAMIHCGIWQSAGSSSKRSR
jgi:hypothetical protein